jgi:hypothetical protein
MEIYLTLGAIQQMALDPMTCRGRPVSDLEEGHATLQALMERPWSSSDIVPATWKGAFYLHRDQRCLLLWYDGRHGILWLCHVGEHPEGEHATVHDILSDRRAADRFLPDEDDFLQLDPDPSAFHRRLREVGSRPVDEARLHPRQQVVWDLADLRVAIHVDYEMEGYENLEQVWLTFLHTEQSAHLVEVEGILDRIFVALGVLFPGAQRREFHHKPNPPTVRGAIATFLWKPSDKPEQGQSEPKR